MNLSVVARGLGPRPTGRGMVAHEIVHALRKRDPGIALQVFAGEPFDWPGVEVRPARGSNPISDAIRILRGLGREIAARNPDALWCATHLVPGGLPAGLPVVITLLDLVWRDHPETMSRKGRWGAAWLERGLLRADRIACISAFTRDRLAVHFPDLRGRAEVVRLAPNARLATDTDPSAVLARLDLRPPFFLNVDTLEPRKNLGVLLDVMAARPDVTLVHCGGEGWNVRGLLKRARGMGNVRLLGYADEATLSALYRTASAALFPSIYEGFHLPPLDAASLGCPVVVSDIPVHREVLGDAALYVPATDRRAWESAVTAALKSGPEFRDRVKRGRESASIRTWDAAAADMHRLLEETRDRRPGS